MAPATLGAFPIAFHAALARLIGGAELALVSTGHPTKESAEKGQRAFRAFARLAEGRRGSVEGAWLVGHRPMAHVVHGGSPGTWDVAIRSVPRLDSVTANALDEAIERIHASYARKGLTR